MDPIIALTIGFAVLAGAGGYLLTRGDLSKRQATLVGVQWSVAGVPAFRTPQR